MNNLLKQGERIDDLQCKGYKIIQNPEEFCFGIDAVLLANFINIKKGENVLDLGTGTGIIPILISAKTGAKHVTGVEIQPYLSDMANRSVQLNKLEDKIKIVNEDLRNLNGLLKPSSYDIITCNPPYKKSQTGIMNSKDSKTIARHEIMSTLEDIVSVSSKLLKVRGKLGLIHRPERLVDIIVTMRKYKVEPKRARFVYSKINKPPIMVLVEGTRSGGEDFRMQEPLVVYNENGEYTKEIYEIYYGER